VRELLTLAADVYCLILVNNLPQSLLDRLRDYDQYQGARYELAVAAALVRAGFVIHWKKGKGPEKIYEFDATHELSAEIIAVEAKSKHRRDSLHQEEVVEPAREARADILSLYNEAVRKRPSDRPFAVFIDINLPHDPKVSGPVEDWLSQILPLLTNESFFRDSESPEHSVLAITNSAWHYDGTGPTGEGRHCLTWTEKGTHPIQHPQTLRAIQFAMSRFGIILDD
jgi:hypothetical protein